MRIRKLNERKFDDDYDNDDDDDDDYDDDYDDFTECEQRHNMCVTVYSSSRPSCLTTCHS